MTIIPAIDILNGRCVRLTKGDYASGKVYAEDPVAMARQFADAGFTRLHVVDLDGAKSAGVVNLPVLEGICAQTSLQVDFGGGIKSDADLKRVFDAGAAMACIGSVAVTDVSLVRRWMEDYSPARIIVGADVREEKVCIHGWKTETGTTIYELAEWYPDLKFLMCTDISRDGMLEGPSLELYRQLGRRLPGVHLIASGGVSGLGDLEDLREIGIPSVIVGKAIYEGRVSVEALSRINE